MDAAPIVSQWASIHLNQKKMPVGYFFYSFRATEDIQAQGCEENMSACGVLRLVAALGPGSRLATVLIHL